jgi:hypothetical protein
MQRRRRRVICLLTCTFGNVCIGSDGLPDDMNMPSQVVLGRYELLMLAT